MADLHLASLPPVPGMVSGFDGAPLDFVTTRVEAIAQQIDLRLDVPHGADITARITGSDGTDFSAVLPSGARYASAIVSGVTIAAGAKLTATYTTAGSVTGMGLSGHLWLSLTQATTVQPPGLVSLEDAKARLGITTPEDETWLQGQIDAVSLRVREFTRRHFNARDYRDRWERPGIVNTREIPILSIDDVDRDGATIDPADVYYNAESGRVYRSELETIDWHGVRRLEIRYRAGYETVPLDVQELVFQGLERKYQTFSESGSSLAPQQVRRLALTDVGAIDYAIAGSGLDAAIAGWHIDPVAGFPLAELEGYTDHSTTLGNPASSHTWEAI